MITHSGFYKHLAPNGAKAKGFPHIRRRSRDHPIRYWSPLPPCAT
jgi:hypothetical protein